MGRSNPVYTSQSSPGQFTDELYSAKVCSPCYTLVVRVQLPVRRSFSTFVNHRGYWDKRFLSAGMNHIGRGVSFVRKLCRPTCFLRNHRKRGSTTFYCVDEFFVRNDRHAVRFLRVNNSSSTLSKSLPGSLSLSLSCCLSPSLWTEIGHDNHRFAATDRSSAQELADHQRPDRGGGWWTFNRCQLYRPYRFNSLTRSWEAQPAGKRAASLRE